MKIIYLFAVLTLGLILIALHPLKDNSPGQLEAQSYFPQAHGAAKARHIRSGRYSFKATFPVVGSDRDGVTEWTNRHHSTVGYGLFDMAQLHKFGSSLRWVRVPGGAALCHYLHAGCDNREEYSVEVWRFFYQDLPFETHSQCSPSEGTQRNWFKLQGRIALYSRCKPSGINWRYTDELQVQEGNLLYRVSASSPTKRAFFAGKFLDSFRLLSPAPQ